MLVSSDRTRAWAAHLVDILRQRYGLPTDMAAAARLEAPPPIPSEAFEHGLFGAAPQGHSAWIATRGVPAADAGPWPERLIVNATGHEPSALPAEIQGATILSPVFHGLYGVEALAAPLLAGEPPHLGVLASRGDEIRLLQGVRAATPDRAVLPLVLDAILGRMTTLLLGAADHLFTGKPLPEPAPLPAPSPALSSLDFWSRRLLHATLPKVGRKIRQPLCREDWCVGYRPLRSEASPAELSLDAASFQILECPYGRFFADPFVFRHDGATALFFEDYDVAANLGRISYVVLGENGERSEVTEALSRPYHLSYPFLFHHEGAALMVPETSANGTIELYEAQPFPHRWRLRSVLIDNIEAADTTLHFDDESGTWWLFAAVNEFGSSSHDTLSIFHSDRLEGPWRPHAANPVKFDPASSRPAGPLMRCNDALFRPTQDCTASYGAGLTWCEIEELTPETFRERVVARQHPSRGYTGLHTYGRAAAFEVVDFKRNRWRLMA